MRGTRATAATTFALAFVFGVALVASCGARTGLPIPQGEGGGPLGCVPGLAELDRAVPVLMFVVDASGSMDEELGESGKSRWAAMKSAFASTLPPVDQAMELGLTIYPTNAGDKNCAAGQAALAPGKGHVESLLDELDGRLPSGATPTADAIDVAANTILQHRAAKAARSLVLATDGGPNCNYDLDPATCECVAGPMCKDAGLCLDDVRTTSVISKYAKKGVPTYVIGIAPDDDDFIDVLNEMADAGSRPRVGEDLRYYPVKSSAEFDAALTTIRDQVGACTWLTRSIPDDGGSIVILVDGVEVAFDDTGGDGWSWSDLSNGEISFTGTPCALLTQGQHTVQAQVTCAASTTSASTSSDASSATGATSSSSGGP